MNLILGVAALENSDYPPFGKQTIYFEELSKAALNTPIELLFFSPLNWQKTTNLCKGYRYKNDQWSFAVFELPQVIYDRSFGDNELLSEFRMYLDKEQYKILNPLDFTALLGNKIKFHRFLLEHHLPTLEAFALEELTEHFFQEEHAFYYLKPIFGKGGAGIFILEKDYECFVLKQEGISIVFNDVNHLFDYFKKNFSGKNYLIQAKANLSTFNERPFDIRVLIQNDGADNYFVAGYGVRIGMKKSFVSNISVGGTVLPVEALTAHYQRYYHRNLEDEMKVIIELCQQCSSFLHNSYGRFLEIAFDILLTLDKGPIILEANSKPSRWFFNILAEYYKEDGKRRAFFQEQRKKAVSAPLIFALKINSEHI